MNPVRVLATAIILVSLAHVANGALHIRSALESRRQFAYYGVPESIEFFNFTVGTYLRVMLIAGILFLTTGLLALIAGASLLRMREWARRVWLGMAVILSLINMLWLVWCYCAEYVSPPYHNLEQPVQAVLTIALTLVSWALLTRPPIKNGFHSQATWLFLSIKADDVRGGE